MKFSVIIETVKYFEGQVNTNDESDAAEAAMREVRKIPEFTDNYDFVTVHQIDAEEE